MQNFLKIWYLHVCKFCTLTKLYLLSCFDNAVTTVSFSQSSYIAYEANRFAEITLVLSSVLPVDVTIQINNEDITASKLYPHVCMFVHVL